MFETAIENVSKFTRPLHTIARYHNGMIVPGASTFFFVNDKGAAITCKHVANMIISADKINNAYNEYKSERNRLAKDNKYPQFLKNLDHGLQFFDGKDFIIYQKTFFIHGFYISMDK